jgi:2-oxoglutarate dehydrogenase E1 component
MQNGNHTPRLEASPLTGSNQTYIEQLYEAYLSNPQQVDIGWQTLFTELPPSDSAKSSANTPLSPPPCYQKNQTVINSSLAQPSYPFSKLLPLIHAFRTEGHRQARLDPLQRRLPSSLPSLQLEGHQLSLEDREAWVDLSSLNSQLPLRKLGELYDWLQQIYCGSVGIEYMHLSNTAERMWFQQRLESAAPHPPTTSEQQRWLLQQLTAAEGLERYLATQFPGAKRFSLEGSDVMIPLLNYWINQAGQQGIQHIVMGMAHRGRLNVLVNVLGKPPRDLFAAFAGKADELVQGSGDVKYHQGFYSTVHSTAGPLSLSLLFNPSHLEIVNPVVMGVTRAYQQQSLDEAGLQTLAITLHGDAAFAGQGVVQETFNLSQLPGYHVGGTLRLVVNNQLGFTTSDHHTRSAHYCTDIAKFIEVPILHVNGDDPEAVLRVAQLALDFRQTFKRDVVIDLVSYRRHGHNEADEPSATQPLMYHCIKQQPTLRTRYAHQLLQGSVISESESDQLAKAYRAALQQGDPLVTSVPQKTDAVWEIGETPLPEPSTAVDPMILQHLGRRNGHYPEDYQLHPRVEKIYRDRIRMAEGEQPFDWGGAETLAYATLLAEGIDVRLSGQDSGRGTFFHRHVVLHHQQEDRCYLPLAHLQPQQGHFQIWDSTLSEAAVLAFEYGYALAAPRALVIWEAQFGDFANGAQVVFDQFISASEQKWGERCGVTLLLPHGYEGQGPEHSSARLERYLQLCAEQNLQVCVPSHAGQIYHLLRRQAHQALRRPLIILSPKSLLRHPLATITLAQLAEGAWQPVIEEESDRAANEISRVIFCSGKVYYDLLEKRQEKKARQIALIRIEQLYPFPQQRIQQLLCQYTQAHSFLWCQEEPMNQGAWSFIQAHLSPLLSQRVPQPILHYVGRPEAAATAGGSLAQHQQQQRQLVEAALDCSQDSVLLQPAAVLKSAISKPPSHSSPWLD